MRTTLLALLALPSLALSGCVHTYSTTQTWGAALGLLPMAAWVWVTAAKAARALLGG